MRLVHFCSKFREAGISGMRNTVAELVEAELELGVDAGICDPDVPEGGFEVPLRRRKVQAKPWTYALQPDAVSVLSSKMPKIFYEFKHTIFVQHGMPEYIIQIQLSEGINPLTVGLNYPLLCEATVCWSQREAEFWRALDAPKVMYVERGVDLQFWKPEGDKFTFDFHPQVGFLELARNVKSPATFLFAAKHAQRRVKTLRVQFGCVDSREQLTWMMLLAKLNLDLVVEGFIIGVHPEPWKYYRGLDLLVCAVLGGHMSRVGAEALACGCPTIILEGSEEKVATAKCKDSPLSMAEAILDVWRRIQADPQGVRAEARRIAEKHYSVVDTAKAFIKLAEGLL